MQKVTHVLQAAFDDNFTVDIQHKQWTTTDRCNLITIVETAEEFIKNLPARIPALIQHSFMASRQSKFLEEKKNSLGGGKTVVICYFPDNYSLVVQDATQRYHSTNTQATIHPFAIYLKDSSATSTNFSSLAVCIELPHS